MLPWLFALLATASLAQPSAPETPRVILRAWGTPDGLPQNSVTSIVQTRDGYLWLGTFGGLVRFDGQAFTVFDPGNTPGLASARIVTLLEDRQGVLWIGTEAGLTRYEGGRFVTYTTREGLPHDEIVALLGDSRGRLWIATGGALARFDGERFDRVSLGELLQVGQALAETPDGDVWVATGDGIARFRGDAPPALVTGYSARDVIASMLVDSQGRLWIGSGHLRMLDPSAPPGHEKLFDVPLPDPPSRYGVVKSLAEDRDGTVWIGTTAGGLYRWRDGTLLPSIPEGGLRGSYVRSLLEDRDGNIWAGTDVGGLHRLMRRRVESYLRPDATFVRPDAGQSIGPIVDDGGDGLWIGATCGGVLYFRGGAFQAFEGQHRLPDCVWALLRDPDGTLWIGAMGDGLGRFSGGRFTSYKRSDGARNNLVSALARDRDGTLWVGSDAGLSRFEDGRFTDYGRDEGLEHRVLTIAQDRGGALWVGTVAGLYRIAGGRFTRYTKAEGLSHDHVRAIHEDADGVLWIGTYGGGLNRFEDGRFISYGIKEGLPDVAVSRIIEDPRGNLWMSGNKGVYRVARAQLNDFAAGHIAYLTSVTYGTADGMVIEETNGGSPAGWRTRDGRLWFPTIKGLVAIEPDTQAPEPPPVFIERTVVNGMSLGDRDLSTLGPGVVDAEFHYTAVDLGAAEKTRFRYRLAGYDSDWIDSGTRRAAYYTKLPPGRYVFEVRATDSDGAWTAAPAALQLVVAPFWWERRAVQTGALALTILLTAVGVRRVTLRRARARVEELERERALERERTRIARDLHDDLGSRLSHIAIMADGSPAGDRIAREARAAVETMDELVWAVNATNDTVESFAYYVAQFAEQHVVAAGLRCRLVLPPDLTSQFLAADTRRHLYLAVKEAITNAIRHAQASEVRVSLKLSAGALVVEVADDGCGLPAAPDPTGNGLKNFRERMGAAGGTVVVESAPGQGTRLVFTTPV